MDTTFQPVVMPTLDEIKAALAADVKKLLDPEEGVMVLLGWAN
jgi:hypothetical protein